MLTWWCRNNLRVATAYTWAVTYTLVLPSGVPKQSFVSGLCLLSSSACLMSPSLCISHTWILILEHHSAPEKCQKHRGLQPTRHPTKTTPLKRSIVSPSYTPGPLHCSSVRQPISRWHHAAEVQLVNVIPPVSVDPMHMISHSLEVCVLVPKCMLMCSVKYTLE